MCWRIELFGGPRLISPHGETTTRFATQKAAGLLSYLALNPTRAHSREVLAERFWPEKDPTLSRNSLSGVVFSLRTVLGDALLTDKLRVGLNHEQVTCDVAEFEARLAKGDVSGAMQLSGAEFLPGFYDDWVVIERERLAALLDEASEAAARSRVGKPGKLQGLPLIESGFIGREAERDDVLERLRSGVRLLTLKGMGGVGKTRLAHEVARHCRESFPGGVVWVGLEDIPSGDGLLRQLASVLPLTLQPKPTPLEQLGRALTPRGRTLLILDNTEQIPDVSPVVRGLLSQAPECACLVTSRLKLGLRSEQVLELSPLPLDAAERLFRERATAGGGLHLPYTPAVTELCRRLDGLPLALELAAARSATLTPQQMLDRFDERFRLLQSRSTDLPQRQRTLRAAIDWSYDVLSGDEKLLLAQLAVFVGPFSLEDAEVVCVGQDVLEGVLSLRESSLLSNEHREGRLAAHFVFLESLRAYAAERLAEQPELQSATRLRHAQHFLALAQAQLAKLRTADEAEALRQLDLLAPNLRGALEVASPELAPSLALALARPLQRRGFFTEAAQLLDRGLGVARLPELVWERAGLHFDQEELAAAKALATEARELYATQGELVGVARSENLLGQVYFRERAWDEARSLLQQALMTLSPTQEALDTAIVKNNLALVELGDPDGDRERAIVLLTETLAVRRAHGDLRGVAVVVNNLGNLAFARSDWAVAHQYFAEALEVEAAVSNVFGIARALNNLGEAAEQLGQRDAALRFYLAAHQLFTELRHEYATYTGSLIQQFTFPEGAVAALRTTLQGKDTEELVRWAQH